MTGSSYEDELFLNCQLRLSSLECLFSPFFFNRNYVWVYFLSKHTIFRQAVFNT